MSFVKEMYNMPLPDQSKNWWEERQFIEAISSSHLSLRNYCLQRRTLHSASGYILFGGVDSEYGGGGGKCYSRLYSHHYPYDKQIPPTSGLNKKWTENILDLGDEKLPSAGEDERFPIAPDLTYCNRLIGELRPLLQADGFSQIVLQAVPVYYTLHTEGPEGFLIVRYYERFHLTNQLAGYAIQFELRW